MGLSAFDERREDVGLQLKPVEQDFIVEICVLSVWGRKQISDAVAIRVVSLRLHISQNPNLWLKRLILDLVEVF